MIILRKLFSVSDSIDWFKSLASEFKKRFKGCAFSVSVSDCSYQYRKSKGYECVVIGYDDQDWVVIFQDENGNWFDALSKNLAPVKNPKEFIIDTIKRIEPEYDFELLSKHSNVASWDKDCWKAYNWLLSVLSGKQKCFTDTNSDDIKFSSGSVKLPTGKYFIWGCVGKDKSGVLYRIVDRIGYIPPKEEWEDDHSDYGIPRDFVELILPRFCKIGSLDDVKKIENYIKYKYPSAKEY